ncbi:MAG: hypothetical protein M0Z53_14145 [Thermaerobacter sp.]|nr:hypothetical protein [Thermaerobacter sp.]
MILMASGHEALNRFAADQDPVAIRVADQWRDVRRTAGEAERIFLGQNVAGFPDWPELEETVRQTPNTRWTLWVSEGQTQRLPSSLGEQMTVLAGEVTGEQIVAWISTRETEWTVPALFGLVTAHPYPNRLAVVNWLSEGARRLYGTGGWVDFDWQQAVLTVAHLPLAAGRPSFPFERLRPQATRLGWLTPAPPPWHVPTERPDPTDIQQLFDHRQGWQGWDLGGDPRTYHAASVLARVPAVVLSITAETPPYAAEHLIAMVRLYQEKVHFTAVHPAPRLPPRLERTLAEAGAEIVPMQPSVPDDARLRKWWRPRPGSRAPQV